MARGRKKQGDSKNKTISIRVSDQQYDVYKKNAWIRGELVKNVRDYLKTYEC